MTVGGFGGSIDLAGWQREKVVVQMPWRSWNLEGACLGLHGVVEGRLGTSWREENGQDLFIVRETSCLWVTMRLTGQWRCVDVWNLKSSDNRKEGRLRGNSLEDDVD